MLINHQHQFILIHVHRTGGSSLSKSLKATLADTKVISQHGNARSKEKAYLEKYPDYYVFGFVRNPWARLFSWYTLLHQHQPLSVEEEQARFEAFLLSDMYHDPVLGTYFHYNQLDYFNADNGTQYADYIARFENFDQEVQSLYHRFDIAYASTEVLNKSAAKEYAPFYSERSMQWVAEHCSQDIEAFDYSF